ncbi:MAG: sigma-70 family RNA polymerase sigma factor [Deltaproteobacteria bacterium]|nr:sigma-70 family RNA polymerase sigma factor [Deltaproteobacteria bacterium]
MNREAELETRSEVLVEAARQGDHAAFNELYRRYHRLVAKRVVVLLGPASCEDDLVQETFARAYQQLHHYRGDAPFSHWILRIATNLARSAHRHRRRWRFLSFSSADHGLGRDGLGREGVSARYPELDALHRALDVLSLPLREAVLLHEIEGLTLQEVASCQGVSLNTAASRVRRGRKQLRRELVALGFEERGKDRPTDSSPSLSINAPTEACKGEAPCA